MNDKAHPTSNRKTVPTFEGRVYTQDGNYSGNWVRRAEVDALLDENERLRVLLAKIKNNCSCPYGDCMTCEEAEAALSGDSSAPKADQKDDGLLCEHCDSQEPLTTAICLGCWNKLAAEVIELRKLQSSAPHDALRTDDDPLKPPAPKTTVPLMMNDIPYHTIPLDIIDKVFEVRRWFDERNVRRWSVSGIGPLQVETSARPIPDDDPKSFAGAACIDAATRAEQVSEASQMRAEIELLKRRATKAKTFLDGYDSAPGAAQDALNGYYDAELSENGVGD